MAKSNILGFTSETTKKIAKLSNLTLDKKEENYLTDQFNETLKVVEDLDDLDTEKVKITSQVTGLENIFREDRVTEDRMLTQKEATSNARRVHNGYFVVDAILNEK